jgi:hypothetical protein
VTDRLLTAREQADRLHVSAETLLRWRRPTWTLGTAARRLRPNTCFVERGWPLSSAQDLQAVQRSSTSEPAAHSKKPGSVHRVGGLR